MAFGFLQLLAINLERLFNHDSVGYLLNGIAKTCRQEDDRWHFDLIAAKSPDFRIMELGSMLACECNTPFLAIYDDPHGQRDNQGFYPDDRERQVLVTERSSAVVFMSPFTRDRYVQQGLVDASKAYCLTDSFPCDPAFYQEDACVGHHFGVKDLPIRFVHLGNLPKWRPVDPLLQALACKDDDDLLNAIHIDFYGFVYPAGIDLIRADHRLSRAFGFFPAVDHHASHLAAGRADALIVIIGARHLDNQPSKFFVYLGHARPVLVIGPPGNPIEPLIKQLQIGVYCDVNDPLAVRSGIKKMVSDYHFYAAAYERNKDLIQRYRADRVAMELASIFDAACS